MFTPPNCAREYLTGLRALVAVERNVQKGRVDRFLQADFTEKDVGSLFPRSWTSTIALDSDPSLRRLHRLPAAEADAVAEEVLKSGGAPAVFDRTSEDGSRFRIYRMGSLEVRTTQAMNKEEVVGAVFSSRVSSLAASGVSNDSQEGVHPQDKIAKVVEYVERDSLVQLPVNPSDGHVCCPPCRYFVVIETERGARVVTEKRQDGKLTFEESPIGLDARVAQARVVRSVKYPAGDLTVADLKRQRVVCNPGSDAVVSAQSKLYSRRMFAVACGERS